MTPNLSLRVPWVVSELQIEFNGIAWALNTGYGFVRRNGTTLGRQGDCAASSAEEGTAAPIVDVMVEGVSPDAPPAAYQAGAPANTSATST